MAPANGVTHRRLVGWLSIFGPLALGWPLLAVAEQLMVALMVLGLGACAGSAPAEALLLAALRDPVYASVAAHVLGGAEVMGIGLSGAPGRLLHEMWPAIFLDPNATASGAWVSAVLAPGSPQTGVFLAWSAADALLMAAGFLLTRAGRGVRVRALGGLLQAYGLAATLARPMDGDTLIQSTGLAMILTKLGKMDRAAFDALLASSWLLPLLVKLSIILGAYLVLAPLLRWLWARPGRLGRRPPRPRESRAWRPRFRARHLGPVAPGLLILPSAVSLFAFGAGGAVANEAAVPSIPGRGGGIHARGAPRAGEANPPPLVSPGDGALPASPPVSPAASVVEVSGQGFQYRYLVDGRPQQLRGIGYNIPSAGEGPVARGARLDRDFRMMREAGVNTILGWDQAAFDELLLDRAAQHGIGVILPFELPQGADYAEPQTRAALRARVLAWVGRYKGHPALRMWGLGNEVMHGEDYPSRRREFASFLVDTADAVHAADPNHPVIYRDADVLFLPPLAEALKGQPAPRPWLVYGTNLYTDRLGQVLADWPQGGYDLPLVVSEFAPPGLARLGRPGSYVRMWRMVDRRRSMVLGGFAYVWSTAGPEPVDATFGLVGPDGTPVDATLGALGAEFRALEAAERGGG
jgi:hypothetical protein